MAKQTEIDSHRHDDASRKNIPTSELQSFVAREETRPVPIRYPRDPELDPQLVWRGKDAQDAEPLTVPAVPIYIQEKIHPQVIIADLKRRSDRARAERDEAEADFTPDLFADFNGLPDEEATLEFYQHEANWSNRMILGDSLLVMTSLAEKEAMRGRVQCIYLDPPYGIKFNSNWQPSTKSRDVKDGKAESLTREPEMVRAFRDTWKDGIHSYLSYLRDRLVVARDLLSGSGSIFVQIGDENVHVVRSLMDEVFGAENYAGQIAFFKTSSQSTIGIQSIVDYILVYAKNILNQKIRKIVRKKSPGEAGAKQYVQIFSEDLSEIQRMTPDQISGRDPLPQGWLIGRPGPTTSQGHQNARSGAYRFRGKKFYPSSGRHWSYDPSPGGDMDKLGRIGRLRIAGKGLATVLLAQDNPTAELDNIWLDTGTGSFTEQQVYVVQTATKAIQRCILMTTDPGDLVLDPTCGSGTTAYVAEQWGRRWITIDTSRVALALARQRLMAGRFPGYMLQDSPEGVAKEAEITGREPSAERLAEVSRSGHRPSPRQGFVLERVPHITLKSIANNSEIDTIWETHQQTLAPLLDRLNEAKDEAWEEWEVPRDPADAWPEEVQKAHAAVLKARDGGRNPAKPLSRLNALMKRDYALADLPEKPQDPWQDETTIRLHAEWWQARRARQAEIDASIAQNADTEYLVDKPYRVRNRVRVTGPFTVESLSPHRVLPADDEADREMYESVTGEQAPARTRSLTRSEAEARAEADFVTVVLDNLKSSGVQNTKKGERLEFTELRPFAGTPLIAAEGRYMEGETERRVAVVIGPEYGTVGWGLVRDAAREAVELFDTMVVCGFAFEPSVSDDRLGRLGALTVLKARMNNDLHMAGALKPTGAGNLFVVFGEPDVEVRKVGDRLEVEILGIDVFDPTTGEVRSSDINDIACWFIDTDYNAESFFVRQAYFLGGNDPYSRLKTTLKAEIDAEAWETLYSPVSRPFDPPECGRIAVKVINHYGDEVLKVYQAGVDW